MRLGACATVLEPHEIERIHAAVARIMSEVGMRIESDVILSRLADAGCVVDLSTQTARCPPGVLSGFLQGSSRFDWESIQPVVHCNAGVYLGRNLDPFTDEHLDWSEERIVAYVKVAEALEHVERATMLGCPLPGVPSPIHPLYQRTFCWKHGLWPGGAVWDTRLCPYILEMCEVMADARAEPASTFFSASVYLSTTLTLACGEAEQYVYFVDRGLPVSIGHMSSAGGSAPVTLAGAVALHLAEGLFINMIQRAFRGVDTLRLGCSITPLDMRTLTYPYGRPERQIMNLMVADMAKHYGAAFSGHGGHTDAKRPSAEAGAQRALTTIPTLMCGGTTSVAAGLLSVDEVFSPIQMVIDNEYAGALKRFARGCEITDETLAVDVVKAVGPGGLFTGTDHTVAHFRSEIWEPGLWSRTMLSRWQVEGAKIDAERARDVCAEVLARPDTPPRISERVETELRRVMDRALAELTGAG